MKRRLCFALIAALLLFGAAALAEPGIGTWLRVVNCNEYITLREEPDTSAIALAKMPLKDKALSLGEEENGFLRVAYRGQSGWALKKYLEQPGGEGAAVGVTDEQRYNLNLFLSNFTEASFCWQEGGYAAEWADRAQLTQFAIEHCWFNRKTRLEWGEYFGGNNVRLPEDQIAPVVKKYFGLRIEPAHDLAYIDYKKGWYYWEETGGHVKDGFACLTGVENLGGGRYAVRFNICGRGSDWDNDACRMSPDRAASYYADGGTARGHAVIDTGSSGLDDRSDWRLERFAANYRG